MGKVVQIGRRTWLVRGAAGISALWAGLSFGRGREGWGVLLGQTVPTAEASQAWTAAQVVPVELPYDSPGLGIRFAVHSFLVVRGREVAIVDTLLPNNADKLTEALRTIGMDWRQVRHVILTHFHFDHAGSAGDVASLATAATLWAGEPDIPQITVPRDIQPARDGDEVFGLRIVATPGHTPGHISVLDPVGSALMTGDACINWENNLSGPIPQFTDNMQDALASLRKIAALGFERAHFAHGNAIERGAAAAIGRVAASSQPIHPSAHLLAHHCLTHAPA